MFCPRCYRSYQSTETHCAYDREPLTNARRMELVRAGRTRHIGAILGGRFQIAGFLNEGGTSRVYLAEDLQTKEPVALKVLQPPWAHDKVSRDRFLKEAHAAAAIRHQSIVRTEFIGQRGDGTPYVAMEFLFGESLTSYLARGQTVDADVVLPILREIACALQAAHEHDVIHRDVAPSSIFLIGEPGEPYAVKLLNFGFAKLRDATVTAAGTAHGSVTNMAPEQSVADEVDARTDIYSFGILAFRMFMGRLPFGDAPNDEVLAKHLLLQLPPMSELHPSLGAIIQRCTRKDPEHRYPTAAALIADLDALAEDRAVDQETLTPPSTDTYVPRGPYSRLIARALHRRLGVPLPAYLA